MGRGIDHYERKVPYPVSLPPRVAKWLTKYGDGSLSAGIIEAARQLTDIDSLYSPSTRLNIPRRPLARSHEERKLDADAYAMYILADADAPMPAPIVAPRSQETDEERRERIRRNTLAAVEVQSEIHRERAQQKEQERSERQKVDDAKELEKNVTPYLQMSRNAFSRGFPLPDHKYLLDMGRKEQVLHAEIMRRCKAEFGWESGPKPQEKRQEPPPISVRDTPVGIITRVEEDYSDVFDVPRGPARADDEGVPESPALRVSPEGQLEPVTVDAAETKAPDPETETPKGETSTPSPETEMASLETRTEAPELSTADMAGAADSGTIGTDGLPEPSF